MSNVSNINEYLDFSSGGATVATALSIFMLICVLGEALGGFRRGIFRQVLSAIAMACAAVAAYTVTKNFVDGAMFEANFNFSLEEGIAHLMKLLDGTPINVPGEVWAFLGAIPPETAEYLAALPVGAIAAPFIFMLLFLIISLVTKLLYHIIKFVLHLPKGGSIQNRTLGALVGVAHGFVAAAIFVLPFSAAIDVCATGFAAAAESGNSDSAAIYEQYVEPISKSPVFELVGAAGGDAVIDSLSKVKTDDGEIDTRAELEFIIKLAFKSAKGLEGVDMKAPSALNKAAIDDIVNALSSSEYLATVSSGLLSTLANAMGEGDLTVNIEEPFTNIVSATVEIFKTSDKSNIYGDLTTIKNLYYILADGEILTAMSEEGADITALISAKDEGGESIVDKFIAEVKKNERTAPLITALTELSLTILSENLPIGSDAKEIYTSVKSEFTEIIAIKENDFESKDEYLNAVSDSIVTSLDEHGIAVDEATADKIAQHVSDNYSGINELTDEQFNDILLSYYNYYVEEIQ